MKVGIYARVSTVDQHTLPLQIQRLKNMLRTASGKLPYRMIKRIRESKC
jgi:DNA invertase Pin-like site-specific DNA recombinase